VTSSTDIMTTYGPTPVTFVSGSGTELVDSEGKVYLD
jgi:acetylornithine/succinyldiaminopimelate/putrescine aminotransferase